MISITKGSAVKSVMTFHPSNTEDNIELLFNDTTAEQIIRHTGIRYRKIVDEFWGFDKYVLKCTEQFFQSQSIEAIDIDVLICVTQSAGRAIPSLSFFLHEKLNFKNSVCCLDVNLGCSGYVQGIQLVQSLLASDVKSKVNGLLICGDFSSRLIDSNDKSVKPIFSDAISITHIQRSEEYYDKESTFSIDSFGSGRHAIHLNDDLDGKLRLDGIDVFNYTLKMVPANLKKIEETMGGQKLSQSQIFFHQANKIINDSLARKIGINENLPSSLYNYGNTASASIPLTICNHFSGVRLRESKLLLCGFGIGFSVASGFIFFDTTVIHPPTCLDL
jgi:3-oxoacyl-[acyl-carrier-protein] synthase-3